MITTGLVLVVRRLDNVIRWINLYLVDSVVCFAIIYLLDNNLSVRQRYVTFVQLGLVEYKFIYL